MKLTRYYVRSHRHNALIGPFFRRKAAERAAAGYSFDPLLRGGGTLLTREQAKCTPSRQPLSEPDLIAYARAHVTSPGAHALLDEVDRGSEHRSNLRWGRPS
jgi:hypothetical protein